jgi:hypothetical protein
MSEDGEQWSFFSNLSTTEITSTMKTKAIKNLRDTPQNAPTSDQKNPKLMPKTKFGEDKKSSLYNNASDYEADERFNFSKKVPKRERNFGSENCDDLYFIIQEHMMDDDVSD